VTNALADDVFKGEQALRAGVAMWIYNLMVALLSRLEGCNVSSLPPHSVSRCCNWHVFATLYSVVLQAATRGG
jgi:hypothetical protein